MWKIVLLVCYVGEWCMPYPSVLLYDTFEECDTALVTVAESLEKRGATFAGAPRCEPVGQARAKKERSGTI